MANEMVERVARAMVHPDDWQAIAKELSPEMRELFDLKLNN